MYLIQFYADGCRGAALMQYHEPKVPVLIFGSQGYNQKNNHIIFTCLTLNGKCMLSSGCGFYVFKCISSLQPYKYSYYH